MKTSENGLNLIKSFESLRLKAYLCSSRVPTIGFGHTKGVKLGQTITEQQALSFLADDLSEAENAVNKQRLSITQNQFDALVSFTFNAGVGAFAGSTLLKKIKVNPSDETIKGEFAKWKYGTVDGKKVVLAGLIRRRKDEAELYFNK